MYGEEKVPSLFFATVTQVKAFCADEFTTYVRCIERTNQFQEIHQCRKTQYAFDACMKKNLDMDRPSYAYNTLAKIHDTDRSGL